MAITNNESAQIPLLAAALALAKRGCAVLPCRPKDKEPATKHGFKDATRDAERITEWWTACPGFNVAIATGAASGLWVVDVDGDDGEATLRKLEAEHGSLPETVEAITGKGRHVYFRTNGAVTPNSVSKIGPGIDTRGDGGYVLAPPSIHPSGRVYAWSVDSAATMAEAPAWLVELAGVTAGHKPGRPLEEWHSILSAPIGEGGRNKTLASVAGKLIRHGIDLVVARDLLTCVNDARCAPPLSEREVDAILISVAKTTLSRGRS